MHALSARPLDNGWRGRGCSPCADEIRTFCQPSPVGEGGSRRLTDEVSFLDKETFLLSYFSVKKSTKSHLRGLSSLLKNSLRVHELVARSSAWRVSAAKDRAKVGGFALPAISYYHACEHSARDSRADSCTHYLHARIYRCGGRGSGTCADENRDFCQPSPVGEGGARSVTDEEFFQKK